MTDQTREDEIRKTIKGGEDIGWDDTDFLLRLLDEARRERDEERGKRIDAETRLAMLDDCPADAESGKCEAYSTALARAESAEAEVAKWKEEYDNLKKFANQYEAELADMVKERLTYRDAYAKAERERDEYQVACDLRNVWLEAKALELAGLKARLAEAEKDAADAIRFRGEYEVTLRGAQARLAESESEWRKVQDEAANTDYLVHELKAKLAASEKAREEAEAKLREIRDHWLNHNPLDGGDAVAMGRRAQAYLEAKRGGERGER